MRPRVYISGQLTSSGDPLDNVQKAIELAKQLIAIGFAPLCPHLSWHIDPNAEIEHGVWMEIDLPWVRKSEALFRLPGASTGADLEVSEAITWGVPVFTELEPMQEYFRVRGAA